MTFHMTNINSSALSNPFRASVLRSSVALSPGLLLSVDVLRPEVPVELFVGAPDRVDASVRQLARAMQSKDDGSPTNLVLPPAWTRCAVVIGVDRWLDAQIDETILAADRALALHEAGQHVAAQRIWTPDVKERMEEYSDSLADSGFAIPSAIRRELARLENAFPDLELHPDSVLPAALGGAVVAPPREFAGELDDHSVDDAFRGIVDGVTSAPRAVRINPLHVPARVVGAEMVVSLNDSDNVRVSAPAFAGLTAADPAAERLLCRLVDMRSGDVVSYDTFTLDATTSTFESVLGLYGRQFADVTVDVFDGNVASSPQLSSHEAVFQAQRAFVSGRIAAALYAVGGDGSARSMTEAAILELDQVAVAEDSRRQYRETLDRLLATAAAAEREFLTDDEPLEPQRPLLAELEFAFRRGFSTSP